MEGISKSKGAIGVFDSGYGGLTILKSIKELMPDVDIIYYGDNARAPYGSRSFDVIYEYTLEAVNRLFSAGCPLVILACNTASAKALRTIQQNDLPKMTDPSRRVLGVIRPTVEALAKHPRHTHVGILATEGTINSHSYRTEIEKLYPEMLVTEHACPIWVPLVESYEHETPGADYFVQKHVEELLSHDDKISTILLACTHYPLLYSLIRKHVPNHIDVHIQGPHVAYSLQDYLKRHPEMDERITRKGSMTFWTSERPELFNLKGERFIGMPVTAEWVK